MKVLFANSTRSWGGVKSWTIRLIKELNSHGISITVVARSHQDFLDKVREAGAEAVPYSFGWDYAPQSVIKAIFLLRQERPDLIVTNISKELRTFGVAARILRIPVIARLGNEADLRRNFRTRFDYDKLVSGVLVPAHSVKRGLPVDLVNPNKIRVIHSGIEIPSKVPERDNKTVHIVYIGKISELKGVTVQLKAYTELLKKGYDIRVSLIGEGPLLERLAQEYRDNKHICFHGLLTEPARILNEADIGVLHSSQEGLPNSLLEYMANGLAIVTTPVGGIPEAVDKDKEALFVDYGDSDQLVQKIAHLIKSRKTRRRLGCAAYSRAKIDFNIAIQSIKTMEYFKEISGKPC